ncbi:MAG: thymidylate synthase [Bacilli bacterium]|nr:thymidylate synthase [Bacilli bacterium]
MIIKDKEYKIDRSLAKVTEWDKIYCEILKDILNRGELSPNRTGIETLSIPNVNFSLDVGKEFPILETKKVAMQNSITELLWIYQAQSNDVSWLHERGNHIWDDWMIDSDGIYRIYNPFLKENDGKSIEVKTQDGTSFDQTKIGEKLYAKSLKEDRSLDKVIYYGHEFAGTIGTAYGDVLKRTGQVDKVLDALKNDPRSRRMVISLRQDNYLKTGVLEPCVWANSYKMYKGKLYSNVEIRSNDMPIGNPFNVTQYAVLLALFSNHANLEVGEISFDITDCHIYVNQLKAIKLQLERYTRLLKWEKYIKEHDDMEVEREYNDLISRREYLLDKIEKADYLKDDYEEIIREVNEEIMCFEHLIIREAPILYIAPNKEFYELDNKKDNDDIKILKYTSLPYIKMPVAQ